MTVQAVMSVAAADGVSAMMRRRRRMTQERYALIPFPLL